MNKVVKQSELIEYLDGLTDQELINLHNTYCELKNYPNEIVYDNTPEQIKELFSGDFDKAFNAIKFGNVDYKDRWIQINGYGNLMSYDSASIMIDKSDLASAIEDDEYKYGIELIMDEDNDEDWE